VGRRIAGPDESCLAITLASRAPAVAQKSTKIDLISETAASGVGALPSLASLGWPSLFGSRKGKARREIERSAGARHTKLTSQST
jgi:hypothetical protein